MEKNIDKSKDELLDQRGEVSKRLSSENLNNESLGEAVSYTHLRAHETS